MLAIDTPLSEEESALLALAGWHHAGGGVYDHTGLPFTDGLARLYFRHDDGRKVTWLRADARAEVARVRALWGQVPALLRVARAAQALIDARKAWDAHLDDPRDDDQKTTAIIEVMDEAEATLRAALKVVTNA